MISFFLIIEAITEGFEGSEEGGFKVMARSSVKIGVIMLLAWIIPVVGLLLAAVGLAIGISGYSASSREMARAGIFLNSLGLALSLLNISVSLYLFLTGTIDPRVLFEHLN
jgi:hypothetical protein